VFAAEGRGARFRDVDGNVYADFNLSDSSMFCGFAPTAVVEAVARRVATGSQFLLGGEDAVGVAEELARRYPLPKWQFTVSATQANTEAIRAARTVTGRDRVLFFAGKYHGHFDEALVELSGDGRLEPEERGLPAGVSERLRVVPFNDVAALRAALEPGDVALVITEPAMTNNQGLILPEPGFHDALRAETRQSGTLLAYDETHTHVTGPGGRTRAWGLEPDLVTIGKSIAGGIPLGAWGMTEDIAAVIEWRDDDTPPVATGGTLFGNALSMAAARAALGEVLTEDAYAHTWALGGRLADGIQAAIDRAGLPWRAHRFGPRSGTTFAPDLPRDAAQARAVADPELTDVAWHYLANRGVWEAIEGSGPTCSVPATTEDVDRYVEAYGGLLAELGG
jgi:glutamate-1-semialdehyde 2,1-aminomutase